MGIAQSCDGCICYTDIYCCTAFFSLCDWFDKNSQSIIFKLKPCPILGVGLSARDGHILINSPTRLLTTIRILFCRYIIFQPNKSFLSALAVSFFLEITLFLLDGHKNIINYCTRHFLIFWKVSNGPLNEGMTLYFPTKQSANLSSLSKFIFIFFFEGHFPLFLCYCL